ncbi:MAG: amidohydrolase family protein [Victivallaceae bacterium]
MKPDMTTLPGWDMAPDYEIFDVHIHPFNDPADNFAWYGAPVTREEFFAELRRAGISRSAGDVIRRGDGSAFDPVRAANAESLTVAGEGFHPGIQIHPAFPRESCTEVEAAHRRGVRLIGELVPYLSGWTRYDDPGCRDALALAEEFGMVLSIHPTAVDDMAAVLKAFPKLTVIIAHPGDRDEYFAKLELLETFSNAYLDLSGTGLFRYNMLRYGIDRAGCDRFLFGSDFPICNAAMNVGAILNEKLSESERVAVFSGNFRRLFNL